MRTTRLALLGAMALSLVAISAPAAQQPDKPRKPPKQTPDKGVDDSGTSPGQVRRTGDRDVAAVPIVRRPDGAVMAILDESFEDALVATVKADGSIAYTCLHGLPAGAKHVASKPQPVRVPTPAAEK